MKTYLFVNPLSGHYSAQKFQHILDQLCEHSVIPEIFQVRTPTEIYACCTTINKEPDPHLVIVAGGDGTINAVVNGLMPGTATLAVLPFGTSNVLAAEIGITSIDDALERIAAGRTRSLSVGVIELEGRSLRFVLMAGIGLDGAVVRDVAPQAKRFLHQGAYALSAAKNALTWDDTCFDLNTPEGAARCHTAIICNASRYGGNFVLAPESTPFAPGLAAVCITGNRRSSYLSSALELFRGRSVTNKNLLHVRSSFYEVSARRPIQIDGDFVGYGPAHVSEQIDFAQIIV
ncbi:MAG: diacylglycerol kinase family protein [Desulfuromonadaceae bacterium]|nr:diacylglycerol kinase family protein [Desulfuromonadaceae bacterium]MDD5104918.1 diacylglycerol kinase family protein [Desulfuromonadaceae bacterium]